MSKLTVVICAATFFTLVMAGTLRTSENSTLQWDMKNAIEIIGRCGRSVRQKMSELGPQSMDMHSELLTEYEKNITDTIEKARSEVKGIFDKNVRPNFPTEHCRSFLNSLETTGLDLKESSFMTITMDFMDLLQLIGGVTNFSRQKQARLRTLELHGDTFGNNVSVEGVVSDFCRYTDSLSDEYVAILNGTRPRRVLYSSPEYTTFISSARKIAEKTRSCLSKLEVTGKNQISVSII